MAVSKYQVLARLPRYQDKWELVVKEQDVDDIMTDIARRQKMFGPYYDKFSSLYLLDSVKDIANELYDNCVQWITYREESVKVQSTAIPTGILLRGFGDCKHYASFIGGVLGSLNRRYHAGIDWWYCFAAYKKGEQEPYHVFVALMDPDTGRELWIDPTPGAESKTPTLLIRKKVV